MASEKETKITAKIDDLDKLIRSLKGGYFLRVGIIGNKASTQHDKKSGATNADIGSFHEFGVEKRNLPRRSFLEDSLKLKLQFNSSQFSDMRKQLFKQVFDKNKPQQFLQDLGVKCLQIIEEGFETNGFGLWQQLSPQLKNERDEDVMKNLAELNSRASRLNANLKTIEDLEKLEQLKKRIHTLKNNFVEYGSKILTDTGKLRHSISFKVMKKK